MVTEVFIFRMEGRGEWGLGGGEGGGGRRLEAQDVDKFIQPNRRRRRRLLLVLNRCHSLSDPHHSLCKCV